MILFHISDQLIFWHQCLHDGPSQQVGDCAEDEDDEISGFDSLIAQEFQVGVGCVVEEHARALVDEERAHSSCHATYPGDGSYRMFREHVAPGGEDVCRPGLVCGGSDTDDDYREPDRVSSQRLCQQDQQGEECEEQHGAHSPPVRVQLLLFHEIGREIAGCKNRYHGDGIHHKYVGCALSGVKTVN